jgi:hypothetical protein
MRACSTCSSGRLEVLEDFAEQEERGRPEADEDRQPLGPRFLLPI